MNSGDESLRSEAIARDPEAHADHEQSTAARSSRIVFATQIVLAVILIAIVARGLMTRRRESAERVGRQELMQPLREQDAGSTAAGRPTNAPAVAPSRAAVPLTTAASENAYNGLTSLHDMRDYLDLHRVNRETRIYQLGLTSREALTRFAITSDENR